MKTTHAAFTLLRLLLASSLLGSLAVRAAAPVVSGELKQWHKVTLTLDGPQAKETDTDPNPFTDYRMAVTFTHESGSPSYKVPGYFAADGNAAESSASFGEQMARTSLAGQNGQVDLQGFVPQGQEGGGGGGCEIEVGTRD